MRKSGGLARFRAAPACSHEPTLQVRVRDPRRPAAYISGHGIHVQHLAITSTLASFPGAGASAAAGSNAHQQRGVTHLRATCFPAAVATGEEGLVSSANSPPRRWPPRRWWRGGGSGKRLERLRGHSRTGRGWRRDVGRGRRRCALRSWRVGGGVRRKGRAGDVCIRDWIFFFFFSERRRQEKGRGRRKKVLATDM